MVPAGLLRYLLTLYLPNLWALCHPLASKQTWGDSIIPASAISPLPPPDFQRPLFCLRLCSRTYVKTDGKPDPLYKQKRWIHVTRIFRPLWFLCCCPIPKTSAKQFYMWNLYLWAPNSKPVLSFFPKKEIPPSWSGIPDDSFSPCMPLSASKELLSWPAAQLAQDT